MSPGHRLRLIKLKSIARTFLLAKEDKTGKLSNIPLGTHVLQ